MSDLSTEDMVVHFNPPQEGADGAGGAGGAGELGRRLLAAARDGDTAAVLELMAQGAPFTTDWLGTSPLHLAAAGGRAACCGVLLRAGASRDCRTKVQRTPLHLAAYKGHTDVVELLLARGADVNACDMLRMTPLHWAVERGHGGAAAALLRHGADPAARSKFLTTPRDLALASGRADLQALCERPPHDAPARNDDDDDDDETAQATEYVTVEDLNGMSFDNESEPTVESQEGQCEADQPAAETDRTDTAAGDGDGEGQGEALGQGEAGEGESGAARLLRQHGITLQHDEPPGTALRALRAGRTILLSDAGKLMLKESEPAAGTGAGGAGAGAGVVLRATPVTSPPRGARVFTVGQRARAAPQGVQKVQYAPRPLKILLNKNNLQRLLPNATPVVPPTAAPVTPVTPAAPLTGENESCGGSAVVRVPEQFLRSTDVSYLRAQLLAATAALHRANRQLAAARRKLKQYEGSQ